MRRLRDFPNVVQAFSRIHFVGVGGVGMSGIAEVMLTLGYKVSGSDVTNNNVTERLKTLGASIYSGHAASHVVGTDCVVVSAAIPEDNPEVLAAREHGIPIMQRAAMLAELMRLRQGIAVAGTHGKTTTTSLIAAVLSEANFDPTFVIGGKLLAAGANAKLGSGDWLVAEADESDRSFLRLNPLISVVTNIDADHLENYGFDFNAVKATFAEFLLRLPFYGLAVLCIDDQETAKLARSISRHVMTYGMTPDADVHARSMTQKGGRMHFTLCLPDGMQQPITLALPGRHNVLNALAAASVGWQLGVEPETISNAFHQFAGISRRFNDLGLLPLPRGGEARVIDDYGHHPRELAVVFEAVRGGWPSQRLVVAFQPHRYTRTRDQFDAFAAILSTVDALVLSEVYPAGEEAIPGADAKSLARAIRARGRREPVVVEQIADLPTVLIDILCDGDVLLIMGAGDIGQIAQQLIQAKRFGVVS